MTHKGWLTSKRIAACSIRITNIEFAFVDVNTFAARWFVSRSTFTFISTAEVITFRVDWTVVGKVRSTFINVFTFASTIGLIAWVALTFVTAAEVLAGGPFATWIGFTFVTVDTDSSISCVVSGYCMMKYRLESVTNQRDAFHSDWFSDPRHNKKTAYTMRRWPSINFNQ